MTETTGARALTADLLARLERHYIKPGEPLPGGVFVPEVGWNGGTANSRCDAIYVGFTGSSGRLLIGHELKVSRADWRRELDKPGKADAWADQCHAWYVVVPSTTVVTPEELPHGWGLLTINTRTTTRLDTTVKATVHADRTPSWDAVRSVLSRADTLRAQTITDATLAARDAANREVDQRVTERLAFEVHRDDAGRLQAHIDAICTALGVQRIDHTGRTSWPGEEWMTLGDLEHAAAFMRVHRDVATAAEALTARWSNPVDRTREALNGLASALAAVQALTEISPHATAKEALT
jgi:hypothetical protein